jgi:Lhr-like helicase
LREISTEPSIIVMPSTTNEAFIKLWSGEQTYRPFQVPQAVLPRSLIVLRDRLYGGLHCSATIS